MTSELVPAGDSPLGPPRAILGRFFDSLNPKTVRAYRKCLERLATWSKAGTVEEVSEALLRESERPARDAGRANQMAIAFKAYLVKEGRAPSYVNLHLAALRSLVKFGRVAGLISWTIDVASEKVKPFRDTAGPGFDGLVAILAKAEEHKNPVARSRNVALVLLLSAMALRRDEVCTLDLEHVRSNQLYVKRKKKRERELRTMPEDVRAAVEAWVVHRGSEPGPLFTSFVKGGESGGQRKDKRLAESSINWLIHAISKKAGHDTRPHGLRHAAITNVLDASSGDIREAQKFAGHGNPATTMLYDDNRTDVAGQAAEKLSKRIADAKKARKQ